MLPHSLTTEQRESRLHRLRPFRRPATDDARRASMIRQPSIMPNMLSVRELNATLVVPVYQQSSWDFVAILLSYCSTGIEAGVAVLLFLLPSNLLRRWWSYFSASWPIALLHGCWLWMVNALHAGRRQAHSGSLEHTSKIVAAGAALAIYNASMQPPSPPRRRSKWRK